MIITMSVMLMAFIFFGLMITCVGGMSIYALWYVAKADLEKEDEFRSEISSQL